MPVLKVGMAPAATKGDLDQLRCPNGCEGHPILLGSKCHPGYPVYALYDKKTGRLSLECAECRRPVVQVAISDTADDFFDCPTCGGRNLRDLSRNCSGDRCWRCGGKLEA